MPIKRKKYPSQKELNALLEYYPDTGLFRWKRKIGTDRPVLMWNAVHAGEMACGYPDRHGHLQLTMRIDGRKQRYSMHRMAWVYVHGDSLPDELDHVNGVRTDNRIENLRAATRTQNNGNRKARKRIHPHLPKGVELLPYGKYTARIKCGDQRVYIGSYLTVDEAQTAYMMKAIELFGEFASAG